MAIDPRISLGVQPIQIDNPLAQYGQVQNILAAQAQRQAAGTQNELAQTQLGQARITAQQAQQAQYVIGQIMAEAKKNGAPTDDPMQAAMQMVQHPNQQVSAVGKQMLEAYKVVQDYKQQAQFMQDQSSNALAAQPQAAPQYQEAPAFGAQGRAMPAEPAAAISAPGQQNMLAAPTANVAPVNAMAAQPTDVQSLAAQIQSGDRRYGTAPGWAKQRELLVEQYKQMLKPEVMHVVDGNLVSPSGKVTFKGEGKLERMEVPQADGTIKYYTFDPRTGKTSEINAPGAATGMSAPNVRAQELKLQQDKFDYEKANPGSTVHTVVNDDGTTSLLAVGKDGKATKVTLGDVEVKGVDTPAKRLKWEQDNPTKEIKEVTQSDGTTKIIAIDKQAGTATPVTMSGADLSGVNTPAQRLAWEKANPGKEIKEIPIADGTTKIVAIDKQTGVATPVTSEGQPLVGAKFVQPTEMAKLIAERDKLPAGSPSRKAYDAKINESAERIRISNAQLNNATARLKEEMAGDKINPATIDLVANLYLQTGTLPPLGMGSKGAAARAQVLNRAAELSGTDAATSASNIVQAKQDVAGQTAAVKDFSSGLSARRVTANNTALNHLETMDKLANDLNNSDTRIVNAAGNVFARATGSAAPTSFDAAKQLVAAEVIKAVVQNGGGVTERQEAAENIKSANSPEQLKQVIATYRELLGGQLASLAQQYETGTGRKDFDKRLSPATRELLKKSTPAAAPANTGGFKYLGKE
jgi:hypothetical protein